MTQAPTNNTALEIDLSKHEIDLREFNTYWFQAMVVGDSNAASLLCELLANADAFGVVYRHLHVRHQQIINVIIRHDKDQLRRCGHAVINQNQPIAVRYRAHRLIHTILQKRHVYNDLMTSEVAYPNEIDSGGWLGDGFYRPRFELSLAASRCFDLDDAEQALARREAGSLFRSANADDERWGFDLSHPLAHTTPWDSVPSEELHPGQIAERDAARVALFNGEAAEDVFAGLFDDRYGAGTYDDLHRAHALNLRAWHI